MLIRVTAGVLIIGPSLDMVTAGAIVNDNGVTAGAISDSWFIACRYFLCPVIAELYYL